MTVDTSPEALIYLVRDIGGTIELDEEIAHWRLSLPPRTPRGLVELLQDYAFQISATLYLENKDMKPCRK